MEGTVTIPIAEYELLTGIKNDFDGKLKSELKRMNEADRAFVLRDRDEYVRHNERLLKENAEAQEEIRKVSEANVKLRLDLDKIKAALDKVEKSRALAHMEIDTAESETKKRIKNEAALNETITRLREERRELLLERDAILGRGIFSRIFNRRP